MTFELLAAGFVIVTIGIAGLAFLCEILNWLFRE